jgi:hypothetical protein
MDVVPAPPVPVAVPEDPPVLVPVVPELPPVPGGFPVVSSPPQLMATAAVTAAKKRVGITGSLSLLMGCLS